MKDLNYQKQSLITRTIIKAAVLMSEFGAESILIEQTAQRLGRALGMDSVEISLIPSAIVLTTLHDNQCVTTTRRVHHKPINMSIVCEIQKIVINLEKQKYDVTYLVKALKDIEPNYYNRWLVIFMVGLSCASFSYLQGGDWSAFFITFIFSPLFSLEFCYFSLIWPFESLASLSLPIFYYLRSVTDSPLNLDGLAILNGCSNLLSLFSPC